MKKKRIFLAVIILIWIGIAVFLIASKQMTLSTGTRVVLQTRPVDPRDLLRGDYVVLNYEITNLNFGKLGIRKERHYKPGETLYIQLEKKGKYWSAVDIKEKKDRDKGKLYIKGKIKRSYGHELTLHYGIESYFVPEGEGKAIEKSMRGVEKSPVTVEVYISDSGSAVIKRLFIDNQPVTFK
ncbi:MAG: GDYXXLXY domain-containing protein [bacterium]